MSDDHLDEIERAVVKALVTIILREMGDEMADDTVGQATRRIAPEDLEARTRELRHEHAALSRQYTALKGQMTRLRKQQRSRGENEGS